MKILDKFKRPTTEAMAAQIAERERELAALESQCQVNESAAAELAAADDTAYAEAAELVRAQRANIDAKRERLQRLQRVFADQTASEWAAFVTKANQEFEAAAAVHHQRVKDAASELSNEEARHAAVLREIESKTDAAFAAVQAATRAKEIAESSMNKRAGKELMELADLRRKLTNEHPAQRNWMRRSEVSRTIGMLNMELQDAISGKRGPDIKQLRDRIQELTPEHEALERENGEYNAEHDRLTRQIDALKAG